MRLPTNVQNANKDKGKDNMKILFSVYNEDRDTEERVLKYKTTIETDEKIEGIDSRLQLYDGFHSVLEVGNNLTFWDIYCFFDISTEIIERINDIPRTKSPHFPVKEPKVLCVEEFDPGNADAPCYPKQSKCFIYKLSRYECGASSFDAIVVWASSHPWLMVFIGGFIWDITKGFALNLWKTLKKILGKKERENNEQKRKQIVYFEVRKFYRNFSKMVNVDKANCQIVYLKRIRGGSFEVHVRTVADEYYVVKCSCHGKIISLIMNDAQKCEVIS